MAIEVGSRYDETARMLMNILREGSIKAWEIGSGPSTCYICLEHIDGKAFRLYDGKTGRKDFEIYHLCNGCYDSVSRCKQVH